MPPALNWNRRSHVSFQGTVLLGFLCTIICCRSNTLDPAESMRQPWRLVSFDDDAGLKGCGVFHLDFERGPNGRGLARVWLATSDGLREYDGYFWRRHGIEEGLPSDFIRCVLVTRGGALWVGTDRGAGLYDGKTFRTMGSETNLAGPSVRRMVEDVDGTIWFCSDPWPSSARSGGLTSLRDGQWRAYGVGDGLPSEYVVNYHRDTSGRQWVVTREGLVRWNGRRWEISLAPLPGNNRFQSGCLAEVPGQPLLFSSGADVYLLQGNEWTRQIGVPFHHHGVCGTSDGKIYGNLWMSEGHRAIAEWTAAGWVARSAVFELGALYSEDVRVDPDGNIWLVGYEALRLWRRHGQWERYLGIPPPRLTDGAGRPWFSRDWKGLLSALVPFRYSDDQFEDMGVACDDLYADGAGSVWGSLTNRVTRWNDQGVEHYFERETGVAKILAGRASRQSGYWILGRNSRGQLTAALSTNGHWITRVLNEVDGDYTEASLAEARDGIWFVARSPDRSSTAVHVTVDAVQKVPVPDVLLSDYALRMYAGQDGSNVWLYSDSGLAHWCSPNGAWRSITNVPGRAIVRVLERGDELWVACAGRTGGQDGLARLRRDEWKTYPLKSVLGMTQADDGDLLVTGRGVLTTVESGPNAEPEEIRLPESVRLSGAVRDRTGAYWMGNQEVGYRFTPDRVPPETRLGEVNTNVLSGQDLDLKVSGSERFWPVGHRDDYTFSWRLDDGPWSPFRTDSRRRLAAADLKVGFHKIAVRARDAGGDVDPTPVTLAFQVHPKPLQDEPWFRTLVLGVMGLLVALTGVTISSRRRLAGYARILEEKVAKRTAALVADLANRRRIELALRESEERYRGLVELNPVAVFVNDQDRIAFINAAGVELLGAELPEQLLGQPPLKYFHPDCHAVIRQRIEQLRAHPQRVPMREEKVVRLDGVVRDVEVAAASFTAHGRLVIQVVLRDVTERKRAEAERQRLLTELLRSEDEERRRIARELHDSTAQHLAAAKLNLLRLRGGEGSMPPASVPLMDDTRDLLEQSLQELRTFSWWLHPPLLEELGLAEALHDYAGGFARRSLLRVEVNTSKFEGRLPVELEMALFRVAQESLTNVHRHSESSDALIRLERDEHEVRLEVQDSGRGLPPGAQGKGAGVGLRGMRERLRQFGGQLTIESDSEGTTVLASLPMTGLPMAATKEP